MSKKYSVKLKMQAVKIYLDEGVSSTRIAKEFKLSTHYSKRVTSSLSSTPGGFKIFQWQAYVKA